jgi:hypothetical protein
MEPTKTTTKIAFCEVVRVAGQDIKMLSRASRDIHTRHPMFTNGKCQTENLLGYVGPAIEKE